MSLTFANTLLQLTRFNVGGRHPRRCEMPWPMFGQGCNIRVPEYPLSATPKHQSQQFTTVNVKLLLCLPSGAGALPIMAGHRGFWSAGARQMGQNPSTVLQRALGSGP